MMTINSVLSKLKSAQKIALFTHRNPDPDAYGAVFGLKEILSDMGKTAEVFAVKNQPCNLDYIFPLDKLKTDFKAKDFDLAVILDLNSTGMIADCFVSELEKCKNIIIIDHHELKDEKRLTEKIFLKPNYAATCEIITEFAHKNKLKINPDAATFLYAGLMGDTDRFLHGNLSKNVFEMALILQENKAKIQFVYDYLYRFKSKKYLMVFKDLIDRLTYLENDRAVFAIYSQKTIKKLRVTTEDVKAFANNLVQIENVEVSFLCIEYDGYFKMSVRSRCGQILNLATKMGGGGHDCAAGFELKTTEKALKKLLPQWIREIFHG